MVGYVGQHRDLQIVNPDGIDPAMLFSDHELADPHDFGLCFLTHIFVAYESVRILRDRIETCDCSELQVKCQPCCINVWKVLGSLKPLLRRASDLSQSGFRQRLDDARIADCLITLSWMKTSIWNIALTFVASLQSRQTVEGYNQCCEYFDNQLPSEITRSFLTSMDKRTLDKPSYDLAPLGRDQLVKGSKMVESLNMVISHDRDRGFYGGSRVVGAPELLGRLLVYLSPSFNRMNDLWQQLQKNMGTSFANLVGISTHLNSDLGSYHAGYTILVATRQYRQPYDQDNENDSQALILTR
ncbi:MAG: hypothetical protein M1828_004133 [Chrysothrix sp. TS-e1954]|nr:MAG: hypothetical protein M1828_004133 [Chrysothrix sp. TS-e1954]